MLQHLIEGPENEIDVLIWARSLRVLKLLDLGLDAFLFLSVRKLMS